MTTTRLQLLAGGAQPRARGDGEPVDGPSASRVAQLVRRGNCWSERWVDQFLPTDLRRLSSQHWTPLPVTRRAAQWISELGIDSMVDIGSGVGKFCVATALAAEGCTFVGLEQRPRLVREAARLAETFGVQDRVTFVQGTLGEVEIPPASAYYLFNPFGENLHGRADHIDDDVELSKARYERDVSLIRALLRQAPYGTYVLKYNGFGGEMPPGYRPVRADRNLPSPLRLWRKYKL
mgnify:CR=1 FL=1